MRIVLLDFALDEKALRSVELAGRLQRFHGASVVLVCPWQAVHGVLADALPDTLAHAAFRGGYRHVLWLLTLLRELRKPDTVLLTHGLTAARAAVWCARFVRPLAVVCLLRGLWAIKPLSLALRAQVRRVCAMAARICVPTAEMGETVVATGCDPEKIRLCPPGLSMTEDGLTREDRLVFLAADALVEESGMGDLVDAMALVQGMEDLPAWEVRMAGHGPNFEELLEKARGLGVESRLALLGEQDVAIQLALAHVAISPGKESRDQARFILSAWACGRGLIASGTPELKEMLEDKTNALVVQPGNAVALGSAMVRCLREPDLVDRIATGGRESLLAFSPQATAEQILTACKEASK